MLKNLTLTLLCLTVFLGAVFSGAAQSKSPIKSTSDLKNALVRIAELLGYIFWVAAVISALYAAFLYLAAGGETEKVSKARRQLWYTVIAIVIALMATGLPALIENILSE